MSEAYKIISYLAISFIISWLCYFIESKFIDTFLQGYIGLLTTILAINIASSSLIAGKLKDIQLKTGKSFIGTITEVKKGLIIQVLLIGISFIVLILRESSVIEKTVGDFFLDISSSTLLIAVFIYFLDIIIDLGKALLALLEN